MFTRRGDATRDLVSSKNRVISTVRSLLRITFRDEKKKEEKKSPSIITAMIIKGRKGEKERERAKLDRSE